MTATLTDAQAAQLRDAAQKMSDEQFPLLRELILALLDERDGLKAAKWAEKHVDTMNDMASLRIALEGTEAERDALRAERDNLKIAVGALTATALYRRAEAAEADAAEADAARLRLALEPFAECEPMDVYENEDEDANGCYVLTENQFRAARSALTTKGTAE